MNFYFLQCNRTNPVPRVFRLAHLRSSPATCAGRCAGSRHSCRSRGAARPPGRRPAGCAWCCRRCRTAPAPGTPVSAGSAEPGWTRPGFHTRTWMEPGRERVSEDRFAPNLRNCCHCNERRPWNKRRDSNDTRLNTNVTNEECLEQKPSQICYKHTAKWINAGVSSKGVGFKVSKRTSELEKKRLSLSFFWDVGQKDVNVSDGRDFKIRYLSE